MNSTDIREQPLTTITKETQTIMDLELFKRFAPVIRALTAAELNGTSSLDATLCIASSGPINVCYGPFEYVNADARIVLVGITPGRTQLVNAINEARRQLDGGADPLKTLVAAKQVGAFSGTLRPNLVNLLDFVGLNRWLGLASCDALFGSARNLVQTTSVLRNPVFVSGENYNGTPSMIREPLLCGSLVQYFGNDAKALKRAVYVPLGDKVAEALNFLADRGLLDRDRILEGLPHPSGANAERIAYFIGRKPRGALSAKTNADKLDRDRDAITRKVLALAA